MAGLGEGSGAVKIIPVIMCGGSGTRLWPASRPERPKQFIPLLGAQSLFEQTLERVCALSDLEHVLVVTGTAHARWVAQQSQGASCAVSVLLEPEPRDSAPAIAAAAHWIAARYPDAVAVFVASDHHIPDTASFCQAIATAAAAAQGGRIVTLGVAPTHPATAYGYISPVREGAHGAVKPVEAFVEKPNAAKAAAYIDAGYLWNSGNFIVSAATIIDQLERYAPQVSASAREGVATAVRGPGGWVLGEAFRLAPKISIDFAVMEKTDRASVAPIDLSWSDLGAWDSVWSASKLDPNQNTTTGDVILDSVSNSVIQSAPGMVVAAAGVSNVAIIAEPDAVLVCATNASQSVKGMVDALKARQAPQACARKVAVADQLAEWTQRYHHWLFTSALPVWWSLGGDHQGWGFHESLHQDGRGTGEARRARVQVRQTFAYAQAGAMGWSGPWKAAVNHGLDGFFATYQRPDGLFRTLAAADGATMDDTAKLYDQAFVLLALAASRDARPDAQSRALALLDTVERQMRHSAGGFKEAGSHPFQANAHMHLFEAAMAWREAGGDQHWSALAEEVAALAMDKFIDPDLGVLREFFDEHWRPAPGADGRRVEPGHLFEWAWLLTRWARMSGDQRAQSMARRLFESGLNSVDAARNVAVDAYDLELGVTEPQARLWPQTERLKAALILSEDEENPDGPYASEAASAAESLWRYLEMDTPGLWRDKLLADGQFVDETVTASTFYHLITAVDALMAARITHREPVHTVHTA